MPKTRLSAILYILLVFGSGILVGVASTHLYAVKASVAPAAAAPRTLAEFRARYMSDMRAKIPNVTDDQVTAVSKILDDTKKKFDDLIDWIKGEGSDLGAALQTAFHASVDFLGSTWSTISQPP